MGRYDESEREYRRAIEINPNYADAHNNLGILLAESGRYAEAEKEFRRSIEIKPAPDAYYNLGLLLAKLGRYDEAERGIPQGCRNQTGLR